MDERTNGSIHAAGSGILLDHLYGDKALRHFISMAKPRRITYHNDCGAAAHVLRLRGNKNPSAFDIDQAARTFAERLARISGATCEQHQMIEPRDFHSARVIYYTGTGAFDPSRVDGLPNGFVINRAYFEKEYALIEAGIAKQIAFGDHGYGDLFDVSHPLIICCVATSKKMMKGLIKEIVEAKLLDERTVIGGFIRA